MPSGPDREPVPVTLVRTTRATAAGPGLQEWRSDATGRLHEVPQARSYASNDVLRPGAQGWIWFSDGQPWVSDTTRVDPTRFQRPKRSARGAPSQSPDRARGARRPWGRIPWGWLLVAALAVAIVAGIR